LAIYNLFNKNNVNNKKFTIYINVAMGSQLMNSLLYMGNYFIETKNINSINYNSDTFPCGILMYKRPFMYVNIFWTIMPCYVIYKQFSRIKPKTD